MVNFQFCVGKLTNKMIDAEKPYRGSFMLETGKLVTKKDGSVITIKTMLPCGTYGRTTEVLKTLVDNTVVAITAEYGSYKKKDVQWGHQFDVNEFIDTETLGLVAPQNAIHQDKAMIVPVEPIQEDNLPF